MKPFKCPNCGAKFSNAFVAEFQKTISIDLKKEFQKKESEFLKEITLQKKQIKISADEKDKIELQFLLKDKEKGKIILDLRNKIEDARKRADTALMSQQNQGEVQELYLEEILRSNFPSDEILPVPKGTKGADTIQIIKTNSGHEIGKILYESKNTKTFSESWTTKLKEDNLQTKAQVMILVTAVMPKGSESRFVIQDGVYICGLSNLKEQAIILRVGLLKLKSLMMTHKVTASAKEKMFQYLTSDAFRVSYEHILDNFKTLQKTHNQEKLKMALLWKEREQALEQILSQSVDFYGSIRNLAGVAMPELSTLQILSEES